MIWAHLARILGVVAAALAAFVGWEAATYDARLPITAWHRVEVLNSPITSPGTLRVNIYRTKVRDDCPVTSERQLIDVDGHVTPLADAASPGGSADFDYIPFDYPIPAGVDPGEYLLRVHLTYQCPGFDWSTVMPGIRFRVKESP
jgi:hypothetical protein